MGVPTNDIQPAVSNARIATRPIVTTSRSMRLLRTIIIFGRAAAVQL